MNGKKAGLANCVITNRTEYLLSIRHTTPLGELLLPSEDPLGGRTIIVTPISQTKKLRLGVLSSLPEIPAMEQWSCR